MRQSDVDINDVMKESLNKHTPSVSFDTVWNSYSKNNIRGIRSKRIFSIPLIAIITFFALCTVGFAGYTIARNIDKTDYPFVDDQQVIGKWETVDFIRNIDDFVPEKKSWQGGEFLTALAFIKDGKMLSSIEGGNLATTTFSWTKGLVLNKQEKTASKYEIKEMGSSTYLFFEWKSGDYIFDNMKPYYYVLKKADSKDYSNHTITRIEDKVDFPFIDDPNMKGKWESVDFVRNPDGFQPGVKSWRDDLFLTGLSFGENGKLTCSTTKGQYFHAEITWTKGMILSKIDKTASKCEIKDIDGSTYMFYEWKSGDYTDRGMKPQYYVLKKVQ